MHGDLEMLMGIMKLKALPSIYLAFTCELHLRVTENHCKTRQQNEKYTDTAAYCVQ